VENILRYLSLIIVLAPLTGALIAGLAGKKVGKRGAHWVTIIGVGMAFLASLWIFKLIILDNFPPYNDTIYTWGISGGLSFDVGFLVDRLSAVMMVIVSFVSLLVHIYSIGYMEDDPGYQRFFCYMSLFTFSMLTLVLANNFMLLFFGWEGVGLVSYLLIGFWFKRDSAAAGGLKAFLVNRVGDFGFILAIGAILTYFGTVNYAPVFAEASSLTAASINVLPNTSWSVITLICMLLFIGAMGKSAQVPLHVWLPESMEGPTPISALIHAATMVTAGVYMLARMSPLFELSEVALGTVMVVGASGALFLGILAIVQNDIKRVIAYSTMSQLGYMVAATGASAYSAGMFHLLTHAFFKALLFLAAGSVIIAMHHEQDMRKMGGLKKYLPWTYITFLIGGLALCAIPPFAGFYSKDSIIDAVKISTIPGAGYTYFCLLIGAFVTATYTFRAIFLTFHGEERMDEETRSHLHETPWSMRAPLVILAIPSAIIGMILAGPMLYETPGMLGNSIYVTPQHNVMAQLAHHFHGAINAIGHAVFSLTFWFAIAGIVLAWFSYIKFPHWPRQLETRFFWLYKILINKYGFDAFNNWVFVKGSQRLSRFFYEKADMQLIDDRFVNGSGRSIIQLSKQVRRLQSGYLYHYAFAMILGLLGLLVWMLLLTT
jgi:NADH-quinone oxidoreductase subunit L